MIYKIISMLIIVFHLVSCRDDAGFQSMVKSQLDIIRDQTIPDKSLDYFDVDVLRENGEWQASGSILNDSAWMEVNKYLNSQGNLGSGA